ncbi:MAG: SDR family oxidoreductase [Burkholderiales bacterium]|nr:SDR family oxidoreductase [Burkholderiales bacterium]
MVQVTGSPAHFLITGAGGFVGTALCRTLAERGLQARSAVRRTGGDTSLPQVAIGDIGPDTDWRRALQDVDCVIHLAARAHVMRDDAADPLAAYRHVNVAGTVRLARDAAAQGVRRLVFMSSVKVNGERTGERPYTEEDAPQPEDAYGLSKWEAEQALWKITAETGIEVVVARAPLVYGPGVKGNFLRLMHLVARGRPLPLESVENRRSLVYLGNLVDALIACAQSPAAAGGTFLVSDGEDISTPDLIRGIAASLGTAPRLLPCPVALLNFAATLLGKGAEAKRLTGSLQVDSTKIRRELGWQPPFTFTHGLEVTGRWLKGSTATGSREREFEI